MPRRVGELLGHTRCPECDSACAEVRRDRAGHPYRKCARCRPARIYFTHGSPAKVKRLLEKTRPLERPKSELAHSLEQLHGHHQVAELAEA